MNWRASLMLGLFLLLSACGGLVEVTIEYPTGASAAGSPTRASGTLPFGPSASPQSTQTTTAPAIAGITETPPDLPATQPDLPTATVCGPSSKWVPYTVQPGDTLFDIGLRTDTSVQQLQAANCLANTTIRAGQQLFVPYIPTPTFTPTPTPWPTTTADPEGILSPDGKRYALNSGLVFDREQARMGVVSAESSPWLRFWRWTADSRYAIFIRLNQYGNGQTLVFDVPSWQTLFVTSGCASPTAPCLEYPKALHPSAPRLLLADGRLVILPAFQPLDLLAPWRSGSMLVTEAAWSPGGGHLVFVAGPSDQSVYALYFALGDGAQVRQLVGSLQGVFRTLSWAADGQTALVVTSTHLYTVEVATGQVVVATPTPVFTATPTLTPSPTAGP
jgi:LysM repeat protein